MSKNSAPQEIISSQQIRDAFVSFFQSKQHTAVASSSLVPGNDPTLLFTNAGMVQFKDVFLGQESRSYNRAVSVQRCVRAGGKHNDLENVGYTARHHTFFEMLGNFSFGDYFKKDAIFYAWEFLTEVLKLPQEKLWVTVYEEDLEAEKIWFEEVGIDQNRFSRLGKKDNFWSMGDTGPCGPCSEIFYDHGEDVAGGPPGSPDEDGDRYIEIWNLVFMQFERTADGAMNPLPNPSIDTGMGLERVAAIMQQVHSNYEIDTFQYLIKAAADSIGTQDFKNQSLQVVADHIRSCAFLILDGVLPSNEGRGYVLRRIIRRAVRHGFQLGGKPGFFSKLVEPLCEMMGEAYPDLVKNKKQISDSLFREEQQFAKTLEQGIELLEKNLKNISANSIPGEVIFKLYDTYGFPVDLTADIAREKGLEMDLDGFNHHMELQRNRSRDSSKFGVDYREGIQSTITTEFTGYEHLNSNSVIKEIFVEGQLQSEIGDGQSGIIVVDKTSLYAESGGQVGDSGYLRNENNEFTVSDVTKSNQAFLIHGTVTRGHFSVGETVESEVDEATRMATAKNHSATHLLHAALQRVLGSHVHQKGSMVSGSNLRFDFSHPQPMTVAEKNTVEALVNEQIRANYLVKTEIKTPEEAIQQGAMALFGEKYGESVRVLSMGDFSMELCGGTHVQRTGDIGFFKLNYEGGIASGVRRIEAVTGEVAIKEFQQMNQLLDEITHQLKSNSEELPSKIEHLQQQLKSSQKSISDLKSKLALGGNDDPLAGSLEISGIKVLCKSFEDMDVKTLRETMDKLRDKIHEGVVVLATTNTGKVQLITGVSKSLSQKIHAGQLVNYIATQLGGKGGGRPDMAQAGANNSEGLATALDSVYSWVEEKLD